MSGTKPQRRSYEKRHVLWECMAGFHKPYHKANLLTVFHAHFLIFPPFFFLSLNGEMVATVLLLSIS